MIWTLTLGMIGWIVLAVCFIAGFVLGAGMTSRVIDAELKKKTGKTYREFVKDIPTP